MTRYCTNCGAPVEERSKFCTICGEPIQSRPSSSQSQQQQQSQQQTPFQDYINQQQQRQQTASQQNYSSTPNPKPTGPKPNNYLALSIIVTILCCWPFGIPAIVNAARVDKYWNEGDELSANDASNKAKRWTILSVVFAFILIIISFIVALADY